MRLRRRRSLKKPVNMAEVKRCFIASKPGKFFKKAARVCVKRFRKWSAKVGRFRCVSRTRKYAITRCSKWRITRHGRTSCIRKAKIYGVKICKKLRLRRGKSRCVKHFISYPRSKCVRRQKYGRHRFCTRVRFFRPTRFCRRFRAIKGKKYRCVAYGTYHGKKFFKLGCKKFFRNRFGKCLRTKVVKRKQFRRLRIRLQCMKCRAYKR